MRLSLRFHVVEPLARNAHIHQDMENTKSLTLSGTNLTTLPADTLETLFAGTTPTEELQVWQSLRAAYTPDATPAQVLEFIRATVAHVKAWRGEHR